MTQPRLPTRLAVFASEGQCKACLQLTPGTAAITLGATIQDALNALAASQPVLLPPAPGLNVPVTTDAWINVELQLLDTEPSSVFWAWWSSPEGRALHLPVVGAAAPQAISDLLTTYPHP